MRFVIALSITLFSLSVQAESIRTQCENAYYATGYVKLHQYSVTVDWAKVSDSKHVQLENIIFDHFEVVSTKDHKGKTIYKIKEMSTTDAIGYDALLENLKAIPTQVSCTYDI